MKGARWKKSQHAIYAVRSFLKKHMKEDNVKIGSSISEKIWEHGNQKPPVKIRIKAIKTDDGIVKAEMFGAVFAEELKPEKKKQKEPEKEQKIKKKSKEKEKTESEKNKN